MRKLFAVLLISCFSFSAVYGQLLKKIGDKVKNKTEQRGDQKIDETIDKGLDKTEEAAKKKETPGTNTRSDNDEPKDPPAETSTPPPALKVYANYDFVPGDNILFEDHFTDDQDGEFANHWELKAGQAILNKVGGELAMHLTDGNYAKVIPRMKNANYLVEPYTIEFDWYHLPGAYGLNLLMGFYDREGGYERTSDISVQPAEISFSGKVSNVYLGKNYLEELKTNIDNKWHHVALAFKNHQLKIYIDQYRVLVVPDTKEEYENITFAGIGSEENPIIFKNVRIAGGGNMNMVGKKFTESKIVTHGINFDVNKATLKPESMGTLNMIVQVMKENPGVKFEIGGHTDTDGADDYNLKLSQQRAEAVKDQLIKMGIDASRLTAKGYGETRPANENSSPDGKANNRRVEFVKI